MSFVTRLTAQGIFDFSTWAISEFREVLEEEPDTRSRAYQLQGRWLDVRIPFTAQWINLAGPVLFQNSANKKYLGKIAAGGRLWKKLDGFEGFSPERWNFWRERFGEIAKSVQINIDTKRVAEETEAWMKHNAQFGS